MGLPDLKFFDNEPERKVKAPEYISSGEVRDITIVAYCLGLLEMDKDGVFVNEELTKEVSEIETKIRALIANYSSVKPKVMKGLARITNTIQQIPEGLQVQLTVLALNMLYFTLQKNERSKPLSKRLQDFWEENDSKVLSLTDEYFDMSDANRDEISAETFKFTMYLMERL